MSIIYEKLAEDLVNETVVHRLYGEGTIESTNGNHITVLFENEKKSDFLFPACFDKFLQLKNISKQDEMDIIIKDWREKSGVARSETIKQKTLSTQKAINKRNEVRKKERLDKAKQEAQRSKFFSNSYQKKVISEEAN